MVSNVGGANTIALDDKPANEIINTNLARLVSGDGSSVTVVSIKSITQKVVAGSLYEYKGTFKVDKKETECTISAWSRPWLDDANEKLKIKAACGSVNLHAKDDDGDW
jgi:hypothetical protein